jgi:hypothetical protein
MFMVVNISVLLVTIYWCEAFVNMMGVVVGVVPLWFIYAMCVNE